MVFNRPSNLFGQPLKPVDSRQWLWRNDKNPALSRNFRKGHLCHAMLTNEFNCHADVFDKSLFQIPVDHSPLLYPRYPAHGFSFSNKRDANEKHCKIISNNCLSFHTFDSGDSWSICTFSQYICCFPTFAVSLPLINWNSFGVSQESWERHICSNQEFQLFH